MHVIQMMAQYIKNNCKTEFEEYWRDQYPDATREQVHDSLDYYASESFKNAWYDAPPTGHA